MKKKYYAIVSLMALLCANLTAAQDAPKAQDKETPKNSDVTLVTPQPIQGRLFLGDDSYLGVYLEEVTPERVKELNLKEERGAVIMKVAEGGPAEKAGLKENDVIVAFNGRRVDTVRELQRLLGETPAGRTVTFEIIRGGRTETLSATLTKRSPVSVWNLNNDEALRRYERDLQRLDRQFKLNEEQQERLRKRAEEAARNAQQLQGKLHVVPMPDVGNMNFDFRGLNYTFTGRRLGVTAESLTDQLANYFGVKDGKGVLVTEVFDNSPAAKAGLKAGDIILEVDNQKLENAGDLIKALRKQEDGEINLKIVRNRNEQLIKIKLEKR